MSPLPCPFSLQPHHLRLRNIDRSDPASDFFDFHFYHIGCNTIDSMKYADLEKIFQAGLISQEQRDQIATHFDLKEEKSRFLTIVSFIGAILVAAGLILVVASNWEDIPRGVKIACGIGLLLGCHGAAWYLREVRNDYLKIAEALHLAGGLLFLGNIALVGQIYNLSSRPPNAILLWWLGIAALPWLLRSTAMHILSMIAFITWFMMEINQEGSPMYFGMDQSQILIWALLSSILLGLGYWMRDGKWSQFAPSTTKLGLVGFFISIYPATWRWFFHDIHGNAVASAWIVPLMGVLALGALAAGLSRVRELTVQWRGTWGICLGVALLLLACRAYGLGDSHVGYQSTDTDYMAWLCTAAFFVLGLVQIQVGVQQRSAEMVNLGVGFIGLIILTAYINLFGSMARTGLVFIVGGVFLIGLAVYLEKQRRALMAKINSSKS